MAILIAKPPVRRSLPPGAAHPFEKNGAARRAVGRNLTAYGFLCGALICFAFFSWYPMIREIILSASRRTTSSTRPNGSASTTSAP